MLLNSARQLIRYRMSVYKAAKLLVRANRSARGRYYSPASDPALARPSQLAGTGRRAVYGMLTAGLARLGREVCRSMVCMI